MNDAVRARLEERIGTLPNRPGVYLFHGGDGRPIYIGKARDLPARARSYLQSPSTLSPKIRRMVEEVAGFDVILTDTEVEALILENSLVKREQPRYNTLLRDDKNFPYLKMTVKDPFPRVVLVRRAQRDGSLYFGPYLPASHARRALKMVARFFKVAICHERLDGSRPRPCLYYQLDQCAGPCAGLVEQDPYRQAVDDARLFLEGKNQALLGRLEERMSTASGAQEYELAAHYRDLIRTIESFSRRQNVASVGLEEQDYFHLHREGAEAVLQVFCMRRGLVQSRREFSFEGIEEDDATLLSGAIQQYYADAVDRPAEICVPFDPADRDLLAAWLAPSRLVVPKRGRRARFLRTVWRNARLAFESRFRSPHTYGVEILEALQQALDLPELPYRIECFDVSHVQGAETVASMVAWEGGRPKRADYRRFRMKTVKGIDDLACMKEAVSRRYRRVLGEGKHLPDLILIDGGRGQLSAATEALEALGITSVPVAALAKREEKIFLPGRETPCDIDPHAPIQHLVQRIRDEAHRFAVAYHRALRRRRTITSALSGIPGVGDRSAKKLLRAFGSIEGVRGAGVEEMREVVGRRVAEAVSKYFTEGGGDGA